ncbi:hypothetical protein M2E15_2842 [Bacillus mycoides]|nr:hypothetical protein bmyco0001_52610 [Bacillus mycoides DSM 2048]KUH41181.1 hypothetical protein M2E15_2842 [Bacillus mycoides]OSY02693.1 hypothetical protein S2E19_03845 [Bacillus mycoides]
MAKMIKFDSKHINKLFVLKENPSYFEKRLIKNRITLVN